MKNRHLFALNLAWSCGVLVVTAEAANPFSITVNYTGDSAYESYFTSAAAYWERLIPSYIDGNQGLADFPGITIAASTAVMDGLGGKLASAGPLTGGYDDAEYLLTATGLMEFDVADAAAMGSNLEKVILHEMAHVIGIGTLWELNTLYNKTQAPGKYTGAYGLAGYHTEFGQSGTWVPVELGGGEGTAHGHWNEVDGGGSATGLVSSVSKLDMRNELMTGWINPIDPFFISSMTRGSLRDLGYNTQTIWTSSDGSGDAAWNEPVNWGGSLPAEFEFATFPETAPIYVRNVTLGENTVRINTLQLENDWNVLIKDGTLNTLNISSTGTGTTTFENVTVSGTPNISVSESSTLVFGSVTAANLLGEGTIGGNVTVGGAHSIGGLGSVGTQNFSNDLTYASGSVFEWDLDTSTATGLFDSLVIADGGTLTVNEGAIFKVFSSTSFTDTFWNTPRSWSVMGGFDMSNFTLGYVPSGVEQTADSFASEGFFSFEPISGASLVWSPVPEPSSALAGILILGGLLRRRRISS